MLFESHSLLQVQAKMILNELQQMGCKPKGKGILHFNNNKDYIQTFCALILSGFNIATVETTSHKSDIHRTLGGAQFGNHNQITSSSVYALSDPTEWIIILSKYHLNHASMQTAWVKAETCSETIYFRNFNNNYVNGYK